MRLSDCHTDFVHFVEANPKFLDRSTFPELDRVVQEFEQPVHRQFQAGAVGSEAHNLIWGFLAIAGEYGGGYLRAVPSGAGGVVNEARGARPLGSSE